MNMKSKLADLLKRTTIPTKSRYSSTFKKIRFLLLLFFCSCSFPTDPEIKYGIILSYDDIPDTVEDTAPLKSMSVKPWQGLKYDTIVNLPAKQKVDIQD